MDNPDSDSAYGQPPPPTAPTAAGYTDGYGIASIIMALFMFTIPGLVVGLIGASKAKRLRVSPAVSRVGWILNLVFLVISSVILIALIAYVATHPDEIKSELSSLEGVSQTTVTSGGASLRIPSSFESIEADYPDADIAQGDLQGETYVVTYHDSVADIAAGTTINDYSDLSYQAFATESGYSNQTRTQLAAGTISNPHNYEVADYRIDASYEGYNFVYFMRYVRTATNYYTVMSWTMPSELDSNKSRLFDILASFEET